MKFTGQCVCGGVTWTVDGEAVSQFYCHCRSCQKATSAPAVAIAIFPASDVAFSGQPASLSVTGEEGAAARLYCAAVVHELLTSRARRALQNCWQCSRLFATQQIGFNPACISFTKRVVSKSVTNCQSILICPKLLVAAVRLSRVLTS